MSTKACETCGGLGEVGKPCDVVAGWCETCDEPGYDCPGMYGTCDECEGDGVVADTAKTGVP